VEHCVQVDNTNAWTRNGYRRLKYGESLCFVVEGKDA